MPLVIKRSKPVVERLQNKIVVKSRVQSEAIQTSIGVECGTKILLVQIVSFVWSTVSVVSSPLLHLTAMIGRRRQSEKPSRI
jgi:hypothetical protein